jgi:[acyl-carrier-protein] S-malonyltransferase
MESARIELAEAIHSTTFGNPICPIYQNATAECYLEPDRIKDNLIAQLTAPVLWTQLTRNMIRDGATLFTEVGPGTVLQGLISKIGQNVTVESL